MTKKLKIRVIGSLGILILSGCSSKYPVTYNSTPTGASVICNGINYGYTPKKLYWEPSKKDKENGYIRTQSCYAGWISGARKNYSHTWDLNKFPDGVMQTLQRPNVVGYEKDAQFALQVQSMKYQKRQAQAAESAASSAAYQNIQNTNRNYQLQQQNYQLQNINSYLRYGY